MGMGPSRLLTVLRGGGVVPYDFRDLFEGTLGAGSVNGTTSSDGNALRAVTDTTSKITISDSLVIANPSTSTFGDPGIKYTTLAGGEWTIADGDAVVFRIDPADDPGDAIIGIDNDLSGAPHPDYARFYIASVVSSTYTPIGHYPPSSSFSWHDMTVGTPESLTLISTTSSTYVGILSADASTFRILYVLETRMPASGYPSVSDRSRQMTVYEVSKRPLASIYSDWATDYAAATIVASPSDGETLEGWADGHTDIKWTVGAAETLEIMVRRVSDTSCVVIQCDQTNSTLKLIERTAGGDSELDSTAVTWTASSEYRIWVAHPDTDNISVYVDDIRKIDNEASTLNTGAAGVKISGSSTTSGLRCWPLEVPVNGPFDSPPPVTITIQSPEDYRIFQRDGLNEADIAITGYWSGGGTYDVEAKLGVGAWETIDSDATGEFSGTLSGQSPGQGLRVRLAGTNYAGTLEHVGVGDVVVIAGQSNAEGLGDDLQSCSHPTLVAAMCRFTEDTAAEKEGWRELADPCSASGDTHNYGTLWPLIATEWMAGHGVPVGFIPTAVGGTSITEWQKGGGDYYDQMLASIQSATGGDSGEIAIVLWWQGEKDAVDGMAEATYNSNLDSFAASIASDFGCKIMPCLLQNSTGISDATGREQAIRDATSAAMSDNANVLDGPDFSDIESDDAYHIKTSAKQQTCASRWWAKLEAWLDS